MKSGARRRIAILTHEYYPVLSGGTVFAEKMALEWSAMGYEAEILTSRIGSAFPAHEQSGPFRVRRFRTWRKSVQDATIKEHIAFVVLGLPQVLFHLWRRRCDLIFSVFAIPAGLMALAPAKLLRVPCFVFVDAADVPGVESAMQRLVRYLGAIFRFVTRHSTGVVILAGLEDLAGPFIRNSAVTIIPNGTDIPARQATPGTREGRLRVLSIGRLVLRKGFLDIIRALAMVREKREDFELTIIGYGTREREIRKVLAEHRLEEHIHMVGRVEYQDLAEHYLGADCYLFYGGREGSSLAMIEAMSYGLPILASDHPGNRAYVEHGQSGMLVEHGDPRQLADALLTLLEDRERLAQWGKRSRKIAEEYSWSNIARKYDDFFRQVTAGGES